MATSSKSQAAVDGFAAMWENADRDFQSLTKSNVSLRHNPDDPEALISKFQNRFAPQQQDSETNRKKQEATRVVGFVLASLRTIGGVVASVSSIVFGPADMCFNAFNFMLSASEKIQEVYDHIVTLFEELSGMLLQIKVLETIKPDRMDDELIQTSSLMLAAFIRICAKYYKFLDGKKRHNFALAFRAVFADDKYGVVSELENFKDLARRQCDMVGVVSLKHTVNIEEAIQQQGSLVKDFGESQQKIINHIEASVNERKNALLVQKSIEVIEKNLKISSTGAKSRLAELTQTGEQVLHKICQWVFDTQSYQNWVDLNSQQTLLCIQGGKKTGKKFLMAAIAEKLRYDNPTAIVLYYSFPSSDGKLRSDKGDALTIALKTLALQNAHYNPKYANDLQSSLNTSTKDDSKKISTLEFAELWQKLKFSDLVATSGKVTYVLLGGLNRIEETKARQLLGSFADARPKGSDMLRVLATGAHEAFRDIGKSHVTLNVEEHMQKGMVHYIEEEMSKIDILQEVHVNFEDLKNALRERLSGPMQDFHTVKQKLDRVNEAVDKGDTQFQILQLLDKGIDEVDTDSDKLQGVITQLERELSWKDVEDLNMMLPWLVFGIRWPSVDFLEALLHIHGRETPVLPLEIRLRRRFSTVLTITSEKLVELIPGMIPFMYKKYLSEDDAKADSTISLKIEIHRADRAVVKQFLWELNERLNLDKSPFDMSDTGDVRPKIRFDQDNGHFTIVSEGLRYLSEDSLNNCRSLCRYVMEYLPYHLKEWYSSNPKPSDRRTICRQLISFFSDTSVLEKKWEYIDEYHFDWISTETCEVVEQLFEVPQAEAPFELIERKWIAQNVTSSTRKAAFLDPITSLVAKNWLRQRDWEADTAYHWINCVIELVGLSFLFFNTRNTDQSLSKQPKIQQQMAMVTQETMIGKKMKPKTNWTSVIRFCVLRKVLGLEKFDAVYLQRLASVFTENDQIDKAAECLEQAESAPESDWHVLQDLADSYRQSKRFDEAKEKYKSAIELLQKSAAAADHDQDLLQLWIALARTAKENHNSSEAIRYYERVLEIDPNHTDSFWQWFELLCRSGDLVKAEEMLRGDSNDRNSSTDNLLTMQLRSACNNDALPPGIAYWLCKIIETQGMTGEIERAFDHCANNTDLKDIEKAYYLFNAGYLLIHSNIDGAYQKGLQRYVECLDLVSVALKRSALSSETDDEYYLASDLFRLAASQLSLWRSQAIKDRPLDHPDYATEWDRFIETIEKVQQEESGATYYKGLRGPVTFLCRHLVNDQKFDEARRWMKKDVENAFEILEDEDPYNDGTGYLMLAEAFKIAGDDLQSLSAWSLVTPMDLHKLSPTDGSQDDRQKPTPPRLVKVATSGLSLSAGFKIRPGPILQYCDGCEDEWRYADDLWCCKSCPDLQLCSRCHCLFVGNNLQSILCHPDHEFLHVPPWSDEEYLEVGENRVRVGGVLDAEGRRVGGSIVNVKDWLIEVRKIWGLPPAQA